MNIEMQSMLLTMLLKLLRYFNLLLSFMIKQIHNTNISEIRKNFV